MYAFELLSHLWTFCLRLIMVSPGFVNCDDPGQKDLPLSMKTLQQFRTDGFPLMSVLGCGTLRNSSCTYLRISQSINNCHFTSIADWKLCGQCQLVVRHSTWIMSSARCNMCGLVAVAGRPDCGRSCSSVSPLLWTQLPTVLLSTAQLPYTTHNRLWIFPTISFSTTKNSITACCLQCVSQTQFSRPTTSAISVGRPCFLTHVHNKHQFATAQFSHFYLYYGMRKKMWCINFRATFVVSSVTRPDDLDFESWHGINIFFFSIISSLALGPTQLCVEWGLWYFQRGEVCGIWLWPGSSIYSQAYEWVELYLCFPNVSAWCGQG